MHPTHVIVATNRIKANPKNARTHSKRQIRKIIASIRAFGFVTSVLIDEHDVLIAGHGRLEAAKSLGMLSLPAFRDGLGLLTIHVLGPSSCHPWLRIVDDAPVISNRQCRPEPSAKKPLCTECLSGASLRQLAYAFVMELSPARDLRNAMI